MPFFPLRLKRKRAKMRWKHAKNATFNCNCWFTSVWMQTSNWEKLFACFCLIFPLFLFTNSKKSKKLWKNLFWLANKVCSTCSLVKIYNILGMFHLAYVFTCGDTCHTWHWMAGCFNPHPSYKSFSTIQTWCLSTLTLLQLQAAISLLQFQVQIPLGTI